MFDILSVRQGFATNSSSSHSLIFVNDPIPDSDCDQFYFGWHHFSAASQESKMRYLALILQQNLYRQFYDMHSHSNHSVDFLIYPIVKDWTGVDLSVSISDNVFDNGYVDHQSSWVLPRSFGSKWIDKPFFDALKDFIMQENLVILGGNDNGDDDHPLFEKGKAFQFPLFQDSVCRYDEPGDFWTIFRPDKGDKIRFRFQNNGFKTLESQNYSFCSREEKDLPQVHKASIPELVDLNITNYCNSNCNYCYKNATREGKHAEYSVIDDIVDALAENKCFEIALGGGEPTSHPQFASIIKSIHQLGIIPNFTTKDLHWLKDDLKRNTAIECCGAWAYSVEDNWDVAELLRALNKNPFPFEKVTLNVTMGTLDMEIFKKVLVMAWANDIRVTCLGFKETGRGQNFKTKPYANWLEIVDDLQETGMCPDLSIDTCLAAQFETEIVARGIPDYMFDVQDGLFSAYIDAVNGTIAPSSYSKECKSCKMVVDRGYGRIAEQMKEIYNKPDFLD